MVSQILSPLTSRPDSLAEHYYSYLALPDAELEQRFEEIIQAEHRLPDPERYRAALARLRAWLDLDVEDARILSRAHWCALDAFPSEYRQRIEEAERAAIMNGLTFAEFRTLARIVPWLRAEAWTLDPPAAMGASVA